MILTELHMEGLKAYDRTLSFGPVTVLRGPMGSGKTEVISAIQLLVTGQIPARGAQKGLASGDKIMALARGDRIYLRGVWMVDGRSIWVEREWVRKRTRSKGEEVVKVTESVRCSWSEGSKSTVEAAVRERLGGWAETWAPDDLIDLPKDQLRRRLLSLGATDDLTIARFIPEDCPAWAKPLTGQTVVDWVSAASAKAKERAKAASDEVSDLDAQLAGMPFVPEGEASAEAAKASLSRLRAELVRAARRVTLEGEIAKLRGEVTGLRARQAPALSVDAALAAVTAAGSAAQRFKPLAESLALVESRLTGMRQALADAGDAEVLDEETAASRLDTARTQAAGAAALLSSAKAGAAKAAADHTRRLATVQHDLARVQTDLWKLHDAEASTEVFDPEASKAAHAATEAAQKAWDKARAASIEASVTASLYESKLPLTHCPKCFEDLRAFWAEKLTAATRVREDADLALESAQTTLGEAVEELKKHAALRLLDEDRARAKVLRERLEQLEAQRDAIKADAPGSLDALVAEEAAAKKRSFELLSSHRAAVARRQINEAEVEFFRLTGELAGRDAADEAIVDAAAALDLAKAQARIADDLSKKEVAVERLAAELDDLAPSRAKAEIEADIRTAETSLGEVGGAAERRTQRAQTEAALADAVATQVEEKRWVATFAKLETEILGAVAARLTGPATQVIGSPVGIELTNARGAADCRITIAGVDTGTISKGERMTFLAGLLMSLAPSAKGWRLMLMDELEAISLHRNGGGVGPRETFLRSMVDAVGDGTFDQAIVGGTPDVMPEVEGVTVIDFGAEAKAASGPAEAAA